MDVFHIELLRIVGAVIVTALTVGIPALYLHRHRMKQVRLEERKIVNEVNRFETERKDTIEERVKEHFDRHIEFLLGSNETEIVRLTKDRNELLVKIKEYQEDILKQQMRIEEQQLRIEELEKRIIELESDLREYKKSHP